MNSGHALAISLNWGDHRGIDFDKIDHFLEKGSSGEKILAETVVALWRGYGGPQFADLVRVVDRFYFELIVHYISDSRPKSAKELMEER